LRREEFQRILWRGQGQDQRKGDEERRSTSSEERYFNSHSRDFRVEDDFRIRCAYGEMVKGKRGKIAGGRHSQMLTSLAMRILRRKRPGKSQKVRRETGGELRSPL
jgi:hypothetical protein